MEGKHYYQNDLNHLFSKVCVFATVHVNGHFVAISQIHNIIVSIDVYIHHGRNDWAAAGSSNIAMQVRSEAQSMNTTDWVLYFTKM